MYRVGFLLGATGKSVAPLFHALKAGLRERGYVEGRNIEFVQRYGDGRMERLPDLAAELVRLKVDVIVAGSSLHVIAARQATSTIPVVFVYSADPVSAGFVASLARPGGNVTGLSADASAEFWAKSFHCWRSSQGFREWAYSERYRHGSASPSSMRHHENVMYRSRSSISGVRKTSTARSRRWSVSGSKQSW